MPADTASLPFPAKFSTRSTLTSGLQAYQYVGALPGKL